MESLTIEFLRVGGLAAVSTWGITQAVKPLVTKYITEAWHKSAVRLAALLIGALWGYMLQPSAEGALIGCCGAALSATIVATVKKRIEQCPST